MVMRKLYAHQKRAYRFCRQRDNCALFMEMRLGKTLVAVRANRGIKNLVVAPGTTVSSWVEELNLENKHIVDLYTASKKNKIILLKELMEFGKEEVWVFTNKESWQSIGEALKVIPWDTVILDESHFIKNPNARVTKYFLKNFREVNQKFCLTGTPNSEGIHEFVCQMLFLNNSFMGCNNFWEWRMWFMKPHPAGFGWVVKKEKIPLILNEIKKHSFTLTRKAAGFNIKEIKHKRVLKFPTFVKRIYDKIENEFVLSLTNNTELTTKWNGVKFTWARRLCSGILEDDCIYEGKYEELVELLNNDLKNEQVVVWCAYRLEIDLVVEYLTKHKIDCMWMDGRINKKIRSELFKKFQEGKIRVLVLQHKIAEMGVRLDNCDTVIYFSLPITGLTTNKQTKDRIISLKKKRVLLIYLLIKDTVEEDLYNGLTVKNLRSTKQLKELVLKGMHKRIGIKE